MKPWSEQETRFVEENYQQKGARWCAMRMGRTVNAVRNKAFYLNIKRARYWSDEDKAALVELNAQGWQDYRIAKHLGKTTESVQYMRYRLGVAK